MLLVDNKQIDYNLIIKRIIFIAIVFLSGYQTNFKNVSIIVFSLILILDIFKTTFSLQDLINGISVIFLVNNVEHGSYFLLFNLLFDFSLISKLAILLSTASMHLGENEFSIMFFIVFFFYEFSFKNINLNEKNYFVFIKNTLLPMVFINNFNLDLHFKMIDQFLIMSCVLIFIFIKNENSILRRKNAEILVFVTLIFLSKLTGYKKVLMNIEYLLILISLIKINERVNIKISKKYLSLLSYENVISILIIAIYIWFYVLYKHWLFLVIPVIILSYMSLKNKIYNKIIRKGYALDFYMLRLLTLILVINWFWVNK